MKRLALLLLLGGCTSLEGWTVDRDGDLSRLNDTHRWSSPGRTMTVVRQRQFFDNSWLVASNFGAWCEGDCRDDDQDGLDDDWEDAIIDLLRPAMHFHPDEPMIDEPDTGAVTLARVAPADGCADEIRLHLAFAYDEDPGRCSIARHHGDVERMTFAMRPVAGDRLFEVRVVYTAAHEGTAADLSVREQAFLGNMAAVDDELTGIPRPSVMVAAGKHATYVTHFNNGCSTEESAVCLVDVCSNETSPVVLAAFNVGEPDHPRPGPPGIDAWSPRRFCGSHPPATLTAPCAPPIREKLVVDPVPDCYVQPDFWSGRVDPIESLTLDR